MKRLLVLQVPIGHIPRSISVHCRGELTRDCAPGECSGFAERACDGRRNFWPALSSHKLRCPRLQATWSRWVASSCHAGEE